MTTGLPAPTALLCEHPIEHARRTAHRIICGECGSFWDLESIANRVEYDASYPEKRGHYDPGVGALKVRSLRRWLKKSGASLAGAHVCEVGFGGGSCLPLLTAQAAHVTGLEANPETIRRVRESGATADLLLVQSLPALLPRPVDLWLFQDSFEHIPDPKVFVEWMVANGAPSAEILMVLPQGDSLSQRMMGRLWPHKLPDHEFHWSKPGLQAFLMRRGFHLVRDFYPVKFASPQMILAHFLHKAGAFRRVQAWMGSATLAVPINFGEMGLRLRRGSKPIGVAPVAVSAR